MGSSRRSWSMVGSFALLTGVALLTSGCLVVAAPTELDPLSYGYDANAAGLVVGSQAPPGSTNVVAISYDPVTGATVPLGTLGGSTSTASGVDDAGTIVGSSTLASGQTRAFRWSSATGMVSLGVLAPAATTPSSSAADINASGTIVGWSNLETGAVDATHAFAYDPATSTMTDLGTLGGTSSAASAVNDAGVIVGWSDVAGDASRHAFAYDPATGVMADLGTFGGTGSAASDINDLGQVVGSFQTGEDAPACAGYGPCPLSRAFAHDLGSHTTTVLPLAAGFNSATAAAINDGGVVVGTATDVGLHCSHCGDPAKAIAWELGTSGVYTLDSRQSSAAGISDTGSAVGTTYTFSGGSIPIPIASAFVIHVDQMPDA